MGVTVLVPLLSKVTRHIAIDNGLGHCHSLQREGKGENGGGGGGGWDEMERITVFSDDGALVSSLPCASVPFGLAVDLKGDLLCFDGKCVQIF